MPGPAAPNAPPAHQYYMINPKSPALEDNVLLRFEAPKVALKWYHRGLFYCILALISFFLSEMVSGRRSISLGFENVYLMYPVYFFHLVVLSYLVLKVTDGKPTLSTLFIAGSIFGMFEAYITKEIWHPNWNTEYNWTFGGVSVAHTLILLLFWHNFNSFIVPLFIAELCFTKSTVNPISDAMPKRLKFILEKRKTTTTILLVLLALWGGNFMSEYNSLEEIGITAIVVLLILILTAFWRYFILRSHNIGIMDLLPQDIGFVFGFAGLLLFYMLDSFAYHLLRIPNLYPAQMTVGILYLFFFLVLAGSVVNSRLRQVDYEEIEEEQSDKTVPRGVLDIPDALLSNYSNATPTHYWRTAVVVVLVLEASAVGFHFWQPYASILVIIAYIVGVSAGVCLLIGSITEAAQGLILLRKKKLL